MFRVCSRPLPGMSSRHLGDVHQPQQLRPHTGSCLLRQGSQECLQLPPAQGGTHERRHGGPLGQVCLQLLQLPPSHTCAEHSYDLQFDALCVEHDLQQMETSRAAWLPVWSGLFAASATAPGSHLQDSRHAVVRVKLRLSYLQLDATQRCRHCCLIC